MHHYRRLPLEGMQNIRDLGGYPTPGGITKYRVFVRSELPVGIPDRDKAFLKSYGVRTVIDLRGSVDPLVPDELAGEEWISYVPVPLFDNSAFQCAETKDETDPAKRFSFMRHYCGMADESKQWVSDALSALAQAEGTALFHCTTGKDRTGFISAMLLGLCDVARADIVENYCVSQLHLWQIRGKFFLPGGNSKESEEYFFSTPPENMEGLISYIDEQYGGIKPYLSECGVTQGTQRRLREKLTEAVPG